MTNKFLGLVKYDVISEKYNFDYFTLTDISDTLVFNFPGHQYRSYLLIPTDLNYQSLVSVSGHIIKNNTASLDYVSKIKVSDISITLNRTTTNISDFYFEEPTIDLLVDDFYFKKIEYSEYSYSNWAQIVQYKNLPAVLTVLGIEINNKLILFSIGGTITNYLMQLRYSPDQILDKSFISEIKLNNNRSLNLYSVTMKFALYNLLYYTSILQYEKILDSDKDLFFDCGPGLNRYGIYSENKYVLEYVSLHLNKQIFYNYTLSDILSADSYLNYQLLNINGIPALININKYAVLLKRIFNPCLKIYETSINWSPTLIFPERYFKIKSEHTSNLGSITTRTFYYDSFSGLSHDSKGELTLNAPLLDWNQITNYSGLWTNIIG